MRVIRHIVMIAGINYTVPKTEILNESSTLIFILDNFLEESPKLIRIHQTLKNELNCSSGFEKFA